ncbi:MAG TPA: peptidylprolyl isomerase [Bryobacteraceae bacterium]|nr:peptidylprolyl isomerase [Bryobacteraceae bacterium]
MALLINGELVDDFVIREEAAALRPQYEAAMHGGDPVQMEMQLREWSRENVIERVLLRQEALRETSPIPPELMDEAMKQIRSQTAGQAGCAGDAELRQQIESRIRLEALIQKITARVPPPKNKEVGEYYKKAKDQFWTPELLRASHIIKNVDESTDEATARETIEQVAEELRGGAVFAEVADRHSDCAGSGGDLGWFPRGQMVEEFEAVVFALKPGEISPIFRTGFGFHIATVTGHRPAGVRGLNEVRAEIEQALLQSKREKAMEDFIDALRAKAEVKQVKGA